MAHQSTLPLAALIRRKGMHTLFSPPTLHQGLRKQKGSTGESAFSSTGEHRGGCGCHRSSSHSPAPTESHSVHETLSTCRQLYTLQNVSIPIPSWTSYCFEAVAISTGGISSFRSHLSLPLPWPLEDGVPTGEPLSEAMSSADVGIMGWYPRAYSYPTLQLHTPTHTHSP